MSEYFVEHCSNCVNSIKAIDEEPCNRCRHRYEDCWEPISPIILINSAKLLKKICAKYECINCPFHNSGVEPVCSLAPKDDNNTPATWEV